MSIKIAQAAFRNAAGEVRGTGPVHDTTELPEDFEESEAGFLTVDGSFLTRDEATQALSSDHPVQSEELEMAKVQPTPTFPKLGLPDDRRETPIITDKQQLYNKKALIANAQTHAANKPHKLPVLNDIAQRTKSVGMASGTPGVNASFALGSQLRAKTPRAQANNAPVATQQHENLHLMFNRVAAKHGEKGRINLATNIYMAIPKDARASLHHYISAKYGNKTIDPMRFHEEHLAGLLNYLNNPGERDAYHKEAGHSDEDRLSHNVKMKQAYRAMKTAASGAHDGWTQKLMRKSEVEDLQKSMDWKPSIEQQELAADMLMAFRDEMPEFKAAKFMAHHYSPTQEEIEAALSEFEGDHYAAALMAHKLPVNEENIKLLKHFILMGTLDKSEMDVAAIPRSVKPFDEASIPVATMIQAAFVSGDVHKVSLNGKHSEGAAIVKDIDTDRLWLLKPGSGNLSRAAGIREETASQSRREVAFNMIARIMGLGSYVPKAALLIIDGEEIAALEFFSTNFKTMDKVKREKVVDLAAMFNQYNSNGLLYKWAAMDYLLGQVDRHAGNMMMNDGLEVKMIDAGSTFAGNSFAPGRDPKSFVPFYLRAFSGRKFNVLTPKERFNVMPRLNSPSDAALKYWVDSIDEGQIVRLLHQYQINPEPFLSRLNKLRECPNSKSEFLAKFYSNLVPMENVTYVNDHQ